VIPNPARREDNDALNRAALKLKDLFTLDRDLLQAEKTLIEKGGGPPPLGPLLAVKTARSLLAAASFPPSLTVRFLFAMYREKNRMQPPDEHAHGEDLLRNKIRQLEFLFSGSPADWTMTAVDDGCPEGSGKEALKILERSYPGYLESGKARVLFLQDAIEKGAPEAAGMKSAAASAKGGSLLFGLRTLKAQASPDDVVLYTDADLSTHLGQAGILASPLVRNTADMVAGSRREWNSLQIKSGSRNSRGRLFIHLWRRMLPVMPGIIDTQAAFKAIGANSLGRILAEARETGFAVDIELLLLARLAGLRIDKAGICWIDSEAESSTAGQEIHLEMLKAVARLRRRSLSTDLPGEEITRRVESLDAESWDELAAAPPASIVNAPLDRLGDPELDPPHFARPGE